MRQAIDAAMNGIPLDEQAATHPELKAALDKWGLPKNADESKRLYALSGKS
jgi:ribulose 1,5-bisphosphate carboxylase large subunit-like protein